MPVSTNENQAALYHMNQAERMFKATDERK